MFSKLHMVTLDGDIGVDVIQHGLKRVSRITICDDDDGAPLMQWWKLRISESSWDVASGFKVEEAIGIDERGFEGGEKTPSNFGTLPTCLSGQERAIVETSG